MAMDAFRRSSIGSFIARHKFTVSVVAVLGLAAIAFVLVYFEPQKLLIDERVDEEAPPVTTESERGRQPAPGKTGVVGDSERAPGAAPAVLARSAFRNLEHRTTGEAIVSQLPDGSRILRLENFETSNGPDLRVYLSAGSSDAAFGREYGRDFVELGRLKGNIGSQNYSIPPGVDLTRYRNAVIWCKRFSVGFGVATLQ